MINIVNDFGVSNVQVVFKVMKLDEFSKEESVN